MFPARGCAMQRATLMTQGLKQTYRWYLLLPAVVIVLVLALFSKEAKAETTCNSVSEIPITECEALVALYHSTNGPEWRIRDGWLATSTPCSWYGVACLTDTTPLHVTHI